MEKIIAREISNVISEGIEHSAVFHLSKIVGSGEVDSSFGFHDEYSSSLGGFLIENIDEFLWLLIVKNRNNKEWYLNIYPDPPEVTQAEIWKTELRKDGHTLCWSYKATRHDGKNDQRKKIFKGMNNGSVHVSIPIPVRTAYLDKFLGKIFQLIRRRTRADALDGSLVASKPRSKRIRILENKL